jgi:hypothetical protein
MSVRFDAQGCIHLLQQYLVVALKAILEEYLREAKSGMRTVQGAESLHEGDAEMIAGYIAATVVGGAWAAMDNFGRGSLMDTGNPALEDYRNSELWNPARFDLAIRGRPAGQYTNIFGETRRSSGRFAGMNLEEGGMPARFREDYQPWPPSHALENAARWLLAEERPQTIIRRIVEEFPWGMFIIATPN